MSRHFTLICIILGFLTGSLSSAFAQDLNASEYNHLLKLTDKKKIIGLGEPEHFYKSYYSLKSEVVKQLVVKGGVNIIAFEASMSGMERINLFVQKGGDIEWPSALKALNRPYELEQTGLFDCQEMIDLFVWLREYNRANRKKVKVVGIDFQNYLIPVKEISDQLVAGGNSADAQKLKAFQNSIESLMNEIVSKGPMAVTRQEWTSGYRSARQEIVQLGSAQANINNDKWFLELTQFTSVFDHPKFPRDSIMYTNLRRILSPKDKALVWAANFHLENDIPFAKVVKKLGVFLKETYGDNYFNIGLLETGKADATRLTDPRKNTDWDGKYDFLITCEKSEKCIRLGL